MSGILLITVLIVLNGLFVMAEFALVGAPRAAVERLAEQGQRVPGRLRDILADPKRQDRYIATSQLGITAASLGLGMVGEHMLADLVAPALAWLGPAREAVAHTLSGVVAIAILTYFHIVLGEMVPKALALQRPLRVALMVTPVMEALEIALYPLVVGLNGLGTLVLRLAGVERTRGKEQLHTPEELQLIVEESQAEGLLRGESGEVLRRLLDFGELTAGEVMVPRVQVTGVRVGAEPDDLATLLRTVRHTRYPVYEDDLDHVLGSAHIKDLLHCLLERRPFRPEDVRPVPYVPETLPLDRVLATLRAERTHIAVVMDEHGGTAGVVTIDDLFEEIIGPIEERADLLPPIHRGADGGLHVAGTVRLEEVGDVLDVVLEHEEVDTVSGLVLSLLGRPPEVGDEVEYDHVRFEVRAVAGHGVRECVAMLQAPEPPVALDPDPGDPDA